ncbi:epidermal retinol dehydrogenase 2 isoform X2 [Dermacentor andersoni]|uniref:epidermal retinol dehydrogenase 2 isoform X2 n=1 Tax=Dermacentor andersoni TaxID=34620 RepID=UPI002155D8BD|nr:epidermal retinol dehydrogenase 2-like isoform X2 [Dermacentor andersoni]
MEVSGNKVWHIAYNLFLVLYYIAEAIVMKFVPRKYLHRKSVACETVLVTGAGSGIGRLLSLRFAQRGARLVLWDIDRAGNEETARLIREAGGKAWPYVCNVAESKTVYETAARVREEVGRVDIVVNNAGVVSGKRLLDLPDEMIVRTFQINTLAHYWVVKAFLPDMMAANHGHIVSIASLAGLGGVCRLTDYCGSKFAAVGFQESLAMEMATEGCTGIRFTTVCPFFINTGMFAGVEPGVFGFLRPEYVADETIEAVLRDKPLLIMPRVFYSLVALKTIVPAGVLLIAARLMNTQKAMIHYYGRS